MLNIPVMFDRTECMIYAEVEVEIVKKVNINARTLLSKENNA